MPELSDDRKDELRSLTSEVLKGQLSRREVLRRAALLGLSASGMTTLIAACGGDEEDAAPTEAAGDANPTEEDEEAAPTEDAGDTEPTEDDSGEAGPTTASEGSTGSGEEREIVVGAWAGTFANVLRDTVAPIMKDKFNTVLLVEEGLSFDQLTKMRVEQSDPKHTVMFIDHNYIQLAKQQGLVAPLTSDIVPNLKDVYPEYVLFDSYGVGMAVSWITAYYNTDRITEEPTSYEAWWNPEYKGRVSIPDVPWGPQFLIAAAAVATGTSPEEAQYEIDAGFDKLAELQDNWHSVYSSFNTVSPQLASGEVWLAFGHSRIAAGWILDGAPIKRALVKEGPFIGLNSVVLVKDGPHQDVGAELINLLLSEEIQAEFIRTANSGPVNRNVTPPEEFAELVPHGEEQINEMNRLDWDYINELLAEWTERFNSEVVG